MVDYSEKLAGFETFKEKLDFTTKYLLASRHVEGEKDYSFEEALHIARLKLAEESKRLKDKLNPDTRERLRQEAPQTVNPNTRIGENDYTNQYFFGKPKSFMLSHTYPIDDAEIQKDSYYNTHYGDLYDYELDDKLKEIEKNSNALDVKFRMEERIGSRKDFEYDYKMTKPKFLSSMFNTSSRAYKNFEKAYQAFNNPKHANYGNLNALEIANNQYIAHKIPGWKAGDPIPDDIYTRFNATEVARIRFCNNLNACIKEQREFVQDFKEMTAACEAQNFKNVPLDLPKEPLPQEEFQNQLGGDLIEEEVENNNNEIENNNELVNENNNELENN